MPTLKSIGIGTGLITGATGLTCGVGYSTGLFSSKELSNPNTQISELLDKENKYILLSIDEGQEKDDWDKAWAEYQKDNANSEDGQDKWKVNGWQKTKVVTVPNGFKQACTNRRNNSVDGTNDDKYKEFVKYCTRPRTIQEVLEKTGFKPLATTEKDETWTNRFNSYKQSSKQFPDLAVQKIDSQKTFTDLKNECSKSLKLRIGNDKYKKSIEAVKIWCRQ